MLVTGHYSSSLYSLVLSRLGVSNLISVRKQRVLLNMVFVAEHSFIFASISLIFFFFSTPERSRAKESDI